MSRLYVIVGLIGSGKTTLAKSMCCKNISFDKQWHDLVDRPIRHQKELCSERQDLIVEAVGNMAKLARWGGDAVIDGWWTWVLEWWKVEDDRSLGILQRRSGMSVRLVYLHMSASQAKEAYVVSDRKAGSAEDYNASVDCRIDYLQRKVAEWGK